MAVLGGHPEEVYHCEFISAAAGSPPSSLPSLLLLVASSESLFLWDVEGKRLLQKADAPGTAASSLKPEGEPRRGEG